MDKFIKVTATFYYRLDSEEIDMDTVNVPTVQKQVNLDGEISFSRNDGDSCVINSVELL